MVFEKFNQGSISRLVLEVKANLFVRKIKSPVVILKHLFGVIGRIREIIFKGNFDNICYLYNNNFRCLKYNFSFYIKIFESTAFGRMTEMTLATFFNKTLLATTFSNRWKFLNSLDNHSTNSLTATA